MTTQLKNLEVTEREATEYVNGNGQALVAPDPMAMIQRAVELNLDIDKLEKLMDLQERWQANEARKAFVTAMNAFKANAPTIRKNKHVHFDTQKGPTDYDHATLDHVCDEVTAGLSKHGISHHWVVEQKDALIKVTCVLTHELGHSERTALEGPADTSGSKNAIQAIASAVTYLERYTLLAATGLAPKNGDNDGRTPANPGLAEEAVLEFIENIEAAGDLGELQQRFAEGYKAAKSIGDKRSQQAFITAKDARKAELR